MRAYAFPQGLAVLDDGRVLVTGSIGVGDNPGLPTGPHTFVACFGSDGSLDPSFNGTGLQVIAVSDLDYGQSVAADHDGSIVVLAWADLHNGEWNAVLIRLASDGQPVPGFGTAGVAGCRSPAATR